MKLTETMKIIKWESLQVLGYCDKVANVSNTTTIRNAVPMKVRTNLEI